MSLTGPRAVREVVVTLYDDETLGFQCQTFAPFPCHTQADIIRLLITAARGLPFALSPLMKEPAA